MVNNTVNGKKIGKAAGKDDKVKFTYVACGKKNEKEKMDAKENKDKPSISIADFFRKEDIIEETPTHIVIKAYPGGNPNKNRNSEDNKEKHSEDITH